jgi:hypothetical protein
MHDYDEDNDGRFPDENPVEVRYPRSKQEEQGDPFRMDPTGGPQSGRLGAPQSVPRRHPDLTPADIHESLLYAAEALQERDLPLRRTA